MGVSKKPGVISTFFNFFGNTTDSKKSCRRSKRVCRIEELESRELLSVNALEFCALRDQYADLNLSANADDYNIIEITAAELSAQALQFALDTAAQTTQDDLIVVRTALYESTIELGNTPLSINIDSSQFGSVAIVALGGEKLQISGGSSSGVVVATDGTIAFGGIVLSSTNSTLNIDNVLRTTPSVQLITSQFARIVEKEGNYSTDVTYADTGLLRPLTAGSPIGVKTYEVDVQIGGTVHAYLTGLSSSDRNAIISNPGAFLDNLNNIEPYDAEKTMSGDTLQCWAASSANMLAYTGWGNVSTFQTEDDIFAYFTTHFTDNGGHQFYANEWFLTGTYVPQGNSYNASAWSKQISPGSGGGFYPSVQYASLAGHEDITSVNNLTGAVDKLKAGCAVGMGTTDHAITFWGAVYDTAHVGTAQYYVSLFITDSDDNKNSNPNGPGAPNILRNYTISWTGSNYSINLAAYSQNAQLREFTWLAPFAPPKEFHSSDITESSVTLHWTTRDGATGYYIEWWKTDDPTNIFSQSVGSRTTTTVTIPNLEPGAKYIFQIYMVCGAYNSVQSSSLTATTTPDDYNAQEWSKLVSSGLDPLEHATWELFGEEHRVTALRASDANLTGTLDVSGFEQLTYLDCSNNQLTRLDLSGCTALAELRCGGNVLKFSTIILPVGYSGVADFGTQDLMAIPDTVSQNTPLDLSSEFFGGNTLYTWYYAENNTPVDPGLYTGTMGRFSFTGLAPDTVIYGELTNGTNFPGLTLRTIPVMITPAVISLSTAKPVKPVVTKKSTITSITLSWTLPVKNRDYVAANYIITCKSHPSITIPSDWLTISGKKATITIEGLAPGKKYKFSVVAVNAEGKTATASVTACTKKYASIVGLRAVASKKTLSSVTLTSSVPLSAKQTDGVRIVVSKGTTKIGTLTITETGLNAVGNPVFIPDPSYTGRALAITDFTIARKTNGTISKITLTIDGLTASTKYTFSVRATAGEFQSAASKVRTSTQTYAAVTKFRAIERTDNHITLNWDASKVSGTTNYIIAWVQNGEEKSLTVDKETREVVITDLLPSTTYKFTIRAVIMEENVIVQSSLSAKISVKTTI